VNSYQGYSKPDVPLLGYGKMNDGGLNYKGIKKKGGWDI